LLPANKKRSSTHNSQIGSAENVSEEDPNQLKNSMDSPLAAQDIDNIAFAPKIAQPNDFVKVKFKNKKDRELDRLFLAQELRPSSQKSGKRSKDGKGKAEDHDAVWALKFSTDGRYLASAGQDHILRVWGVLSTPEEREQLDLEDGFDPIHGHFRAHVFKRRPVREYEDHEGPVLDLSWSKVRLNQLT
jgi:WD40 repeat protein